MALFFLKKGGKERMKYRTPTYEKEIIEANDVILASSTKLDGGAQIAKNGDTSAQVFTSIFDILTSHK